MTALDVPPVAAPSPSPSRPPSPRQPAPGPPRARRRPRELTTTDWALSAACAVSAASLTWLVFARLTDGIGWFGYLVTTYVVFLLLFALVSTERLGPLAARDRTATVVVCTGAFLLLLPLVSLIGYIVIKGLPVLRPSFFTEDQSGVTATDPATAGGAAHAIVGSLEQVALALVFTVPLAIATAIFLNESRSRFRRPVRTFVDAMSGLPSVVAGLFIFAVLIVPFTEKQAEGADGLISIFSYNGFMASLALSMVMLPTVTRTVDVVLRLVPDGLREAGLALGSSRARMVWSVVLPTARSGVTTAVVLGIARAVGETAPLIFTSFGYDLMNANPFDGPQESLPLFILKNIRKPSAAAIDRGFAGAVVLLIVVLALFTIARTAGRGRTKQRRLALRLPRRTTP